jgi:hypothetical protein
MHDALKQEGADLWAQPNAAQCGQVVAALCRPGEAVEGRGGGRPALVVHHQNVDRLREGR